MNMEESKDEILPRLSEPSEQSIKRNYIKLRKSKGSKKKQLDSCVVCLEDLEPCKRVVIDSCKHEYCYQCIKKWTSESSNECPLCKLRITNITYQNQNGDTITEPVEDRNQDGSNTRCSVCDERIN